MSRTIKTVTAGRVAVVIRETMTGRTMYVVDPPNETGFAKASVLVATSKAGALAVAEAIRDLVDDL